MKSGVEGSEKRWREWDDFALRTSCRQLRWDGKNLERPISWCEAAVMSGKEVDEVLSTYFRTVSKSIEGGLLTDHREDAFNGNWSFGRNKGSKTECEEAHRKGYEEGYRAAMRGFEEQQKKKKKK